MSVPKKKTSRRSTRARAAHQALKKFKYSSCPKCKKPVRPHYVCTACGFYKGSEVIKVQSALDKKKKKEKERKKREEEEKKEAAEAKKHVKEEEKGAKDDKVQV